MKELAGKTAVVTGAASGMGYAFAAAFLASGMRVVLADVEEPALTQAAESLASGGGEVLAVRTDVSEYRAVEALRDAALARFDRVHVLCNNAGVGGVRGETSN
jgi:NAD(P)-dependent dehydrogenase (short-subunit alcohol dehydrogenase family)